MSNISISWDRLSSSPPTLNDDNVGGTSSERPIGVKKAKLKRKNDEEMSSIINSFEEGNRRLLEMFKKTTLDRQEQMNIQRQNLAFKERKEENKILLKDLNSIADPNVREYFRGEQKKLYKKEINKEGLHLLLATILMILKDLDLIYQNTNLLVLVI